MWTLGITKLPTQFVVLRYSFKGVELLDVKPKGGADFR